MNTGHHPILSLFRYIRNYQKLFTWSCINSILNKILDLMPPLLVGWVIDSVRPDRIDHPANQQRRHQVQDLVQDAVDTGPGEQLLIISDVTKKAEDRVMAGVHVF